MKTFLVVTNEEYSGNAYVVAANDEENACTLVIENEYNGEEDPDLGIRVRVIYNTLYGGVTPGIITKLNVFSY